MRTHEPSPRVTFWVLAAGVCSYSLLQSMTVPTLPQIQTPIIGRLGDSFGKQRMLLVSLGALAVGSLVAALAGLSGLLVPTSRSLRRRVDQHPFDLVPG